MKFGKEPFHACKCYDETTKKKIGIERPHFVVLYNKFMGDVNKANMLLSMYAQSIGQENGTI